MSTMNLLITGGAGFIGSNLIQHVIDRPEIAKLVNLDCLTYAGHLVMFPSGHGFYDLYGRNMIHTNNEIAAPLSKQHDWNSYEILAQGNRIRFVLNGKLVSDWREPEPDRIKSAPIGLQLHSNKQPQEVQWRNLKLETFPEDKLLTEK